MPSALDIGVGDVHTPGAIGSKPKGHKMATITTKQRKALPSGKFADPSERKYPIQDKAHADNAMARLEQQKDSLSPGKYRSIKARIKAAQRKFGETPKTTRGGFKFRMSNPDGSRTVIHHQMSAAFDSDTGKLYTFTPLDKSQALSTGDDNKRVWIQVARTGAWAGHPQGAFQITTATLDAMVQNFYGQQFGRLQWDFDHYSAMPANSGNLPVTGKPAQGWAYDLKREGDKLFALTEWLPLAREYIENDQYGGVSPVIDWNGRDRASGKPIGPVLTSFALTNLPFLTGMQRPIAASINGVEQTAKGLMPLHEVTNDKAQQLAYTWMSNAELLPRLKSAFGLHELATAQHVSDALCNLGLHLDAVDGDATAKHEGIDLTTYVGKLRELIGDSDGMSAVELIQFVDKVLDEYMKANGIEDDDSDDDDDTDASDINGMFSDNTEATAASLEGVPMTEPVTPAATVAVEPVAEVVAEVVDEVVPEATVTDASAAPVEPSPELAALTLKVAELVAVNSALTAQVAALEAKTHETSESALGLEVDAAIVTYKDSKGLTPELRPHLLSMLKATPDAFRATYPAVEKDKQHLLLDLTSQRVDADKPNEIVVEEAPNDDARIVALGLNGITRELQAQNAGMALSAAQLKAEKLLRQARQGARK